MSDKALESALTYSQWLSQLGLMVLAGTLALVFGTSHRRPTGFLSHLFYLSLLPGWVMMAASIRQGLRVHGAYIGYLSTPVLEIKRQLLVTLLESANVQQQLLGWVLLAGGLWVLVYFLWWLFDPGKSPAGVAVVLALALCVSSQAYADDACGKCDCIWPWTTECAPCCQAKLLNVATKDEMTKLVGISERPAGKLIAARQKARFKSLEDVKAALTTGEFTEVVAKLKSLGKEDAERIAKRDTSGPVI